MLEPELKTTETAPYPLCCPDTHSNLALENDDIFAAGGKRLGRRIGPVWSFMEKQDEFYEGKFNNRVRYSPKSDSWLATLPLRIVMQSYPNTVAAEVREGSRVVEIGCAGGLTWFGQRFRMIGIDLSYAALELAADDYELVLQCDATHMPLSDESVDAVVSSCLFEHLTDDQKSALVSEARRILKPGGKLVFLYDLWTENPVIANYRRADPKLYQRLFLDQDGHVGYRSIEQNRSHFRDAGFSITKEVFHERTPLLSNSVWTKFSKWSGIRRCFGRLGMLFTSGLLRIPALTVLMIIDSTIGKTFPASYARGMITVAKKK